MRVAVATGIADGSFLQQDQLAWVKWPPTLAAQGTRGHDHAAVDGLTLQLNAQGGILEGARRLIADGDGPQAQSLPAGLVVVGKEAAAIRQQAVEMAPAIDGRQFLLEAFAKRRRGQLPVPARQVLAKM